MSAGQMRISYRTLSEETMERLRRVVYLGDTETYVISQAGQTLAQTAVAVGVLSIAMVAYSTESMRWGTAERVLYRAVLLLALPMVVFGIGYLVRWAGRELRACVVVAPRYVLRIYPKSL
jgi:ABC-type Fe3+ transport system permease subunit